MVDIYVHPIFFIFIVFVFVVCFTASCLCCGKCKKSGPPATARRPVVVTVSRRVETSRSQTTAVQSNTAFQLEDLPPSYEEAIKMKALPLGRL
ncbi:hypothetical protein HOLleu_17507 [Holothuria leucospilota]|uniref:Uncharacterized protein n=1 Tax=Holothuria leucospilota TaxID=206669 RepID=A0A9Q1C2M0_HOLLE|nr:hypothetical protein HOLleu_17507 [Holothuria leucospilota]